jgi:hypothetical protein
MEYWSGAQVGAVTKGGTAALCVRVLSMDSTRNSTLEKRSRESVLFITLDSCRYDTLASARVPNIRSVGTLHKAEAPSYFTYGSHSAMFAGFTPGLARLQQPILNPKFGKLFKLVGAGFPGKGTEAYELDGRTIVEGFTRLGFKTIGTGAVGWFNPDVPTGRHLSEHFERYFYPGNSYSLNRQLDFIECELKAAGSSDVFVFLNVGETHVPYYFDGAAWDPDDNPCVPFQKINRSAECRERQQRCCEFADGMLRNLLAAFSQSTILVCGDHGDCWGEDGLWEHGVSHRCTRTVPLVVRVRGEPIFADQSKAISAEKGTGFAQFLSRAKKSLRSEAR